MLLGVRAHFVATHPTGHACCVRAIGGITRLLRSLSGVLKDLLLCSRVESKEGGGAGKNWLGVSPEMAKKMYRVVLEALPEVNGKDDGKGRKESEHALARVQAADSVLLRLATLFQQ